MSDVLEITTPEGKPARIPAELAIVLGQAEAAHAVLTLAVDKAKEVKDFEAALVYKKHADEIARYAAARIERAGREVLKK